MTKRERNWLLLAAALYFLLRESKAGAAASVPAASKGPQTTTVDKGDGQGPQPLPQPNVRAVSATSGSQAASQETVDEVNANAKPLDDTPVTTPEQVQGPPDVFDIAQRLLTGKRRR
jgi:hypothetical protein